MMFAHPAPPRPLRQAQDTASIHPPLRALRSMAISAVTQLDANLFLETTIETAIHSFKNV